MRAGFRRRIERVGALLDAQQRCCGGADQRAWTIAQRETAGLSDDELDGIIAERIAQLRDLGVWTDDDDRELGR